MISSAIVKLDKYSIVNIVNSSNLYRTRIKLPVHSVINQYKWSPSFTYSLFCWSCRYQWVDTDNYLTNETFKLGFDNRLLQRSTEPRSSGMHSSHKSHLQMRHPVKHWTLVRKEIPWRRAGTVSRSEEGIVRWKRIIIHCKSINCNYTLVQLNCNRYQSMSHSKQHII